MRYLDLFSGIGGFALAANWVWGDELEIVAFCEKEPFCRQILKKHWPYVKIEESIEKFNAKKYRGTIDLICGGFPCQPYSLAGKRQGSEDDNALWPEMFRIFTETLPPWIIAENVPGIITMELDKVLSDLESQGYAWEAYIIPACAADAPHRRDRVWIVAYDEKQVNRENNPQPLYRSIQQPGKCDCTTKFLADSMSTREWRNEWEGKIKENVIPDANTNHVADTDQQRLSASSCREFRSIQKKNGKSSGSEFGGGNAATNWTSWPVEPGVGRVADGIPNRVDRLKSLGNAIVPQIAAMIMQGIKADENA